MLELLFLCLENSPRGYVGIQNELEMNLLASSMDDRLGWLRWRTSGLGSMYGSFIWPPHCDQSLMTLLSYDNMGFSG